MTIKPTNPVVNQGDAAIVKQCDGQQVHEHDVAGGAFNQGRNRALQNPECSFGLKPPDSSKNLAT